MMHSNLQSRDTPIGFALPSEDEAANAGMMAGRDRPSVNTFDVFDTLIARRSISPLRVFDRVAAESKVAGFAQARQQAEAMVAHTPYTLDAIYTALALLLNISPEAAAALKETEISIEIDETIPVRENLAAVRDGDVLLSDMYLPSSVIRRMLAKAGLDKAVALVVTSNGKHSGRIWPQVLDRFVIGEHCGDHPHSDNAMPRHFGVSSRPTDVATPTVVENVLIDIGLHDLSQICRETRLATWSDAEAVRTLQVIQADLNLPLLILGSIALVRHAQRTNAKSLLFSSRDCNLWLPIFKHIAQVHGADLSAEYFYTSRLSRTRPSSDYLAYARERMNQQALVVDICGTGVSVARLAASLGIRQPLFLLHKLAPVAAYGAEAATLDTCDVQALVEGRQDQLSNMALEMCNYATHGMVADVRHICGVAAPVFAQDNRPERILALIGAQQDCAGSARHILDQRRLKETLILGDDALSTLFQALYGCLSRQVALGSLFAEQHLIEDAAIMTRLADAA